MPGTGTAWFIAIRQGYSCLFFVWTGGAVLRALFFFCLDYICLVVNRKEFVTLTMGYSMFHLFQLSGCLSLDPAPSEIEIFQKIGKCFGAKAPP